MKWSMDTHKYISETTRKALQVLVNRNITSESSPEEIDAAEQELGSCGVYKSYDNAKGRIRRALFTYFKAYGCLDSEEHLTELGRLYAEEKLTIQEFSFYYVLNYQYEDDTFKYYPSELVLTCLIALYDRNASEAYLSPYDFSKIVECNSLEDINEGFIDELLRVRSSGGKEVNERAIGFDVWAKMYVQSGILKRTADRTLYADNIPLIKWILNAYQKKYVTKMGEVCTGVLQDFPVINLVNNDGNPEEYANEGKALQAFLFDSVEDSIIDKYIICNKTNTASKMRDVLGISENEVGFYSIYKGLERLVGYSLIHNHDTRVQLIGSILASVELTEEQLQDISYEETRIDYDAFERLTTGCNVLLYGVPGSGKSYTIEHEYCRPTSRVERLVFHPDYTYSDFIGQILPAVDENGQVSYKFTAGPFTNILKESYKNPATEYILIIEEINRGNAPAIFGEVFQLLDRKVEYREVDDDGFPIGTSEYGITNANIAKIVYGDEKHKVRIPSNLSIIGTMNTSDQNVFTLDTAFQRRWDMRLIENNFENVDPSLADTTILDTSVTWKDFCTEINKIVVGNGARMTSAEDKRLGAYFVHLRDLKFDERMGDLADGEYDSLRKKESHKQLTDTEKARLAEVRDAMKQNRKFPEKVIKYLWDDAFKFNREIMFETTEYQSLEQVIRAFMYAEKLDRFKMFKENVRSAFTNPED